MKKLIALLLCMVMVVSVLAGCGPTAKPGNDDTTTGAADDTLPEDITLTIGIPRSGKVEDYDTNAYTLWLEEQTGYDLQFHIYEGTVNDYKSQLSVAMIDGDELPDILLGMGLGAGVYEEYGEDGYFIDLAPYFEDKEKSGSWWERFDNYEDEKFRTAVWNNMVADDGGIYAFPSLQSSSYDAMAHQAFINQDWLDKLNLPMPTDIDSLYDTLVAFKTKDPNGNGKADETPIIGMTVGWGDTVTWLINMFIYHNSSKFWRVDDQGQLYHIYASDEYREALKFINKLVKEGLLPSTVWTTNNSNDIKAMLTPADGVQTVGIFLDHPSLCLATDDANIYSYAAMPYWGYAKLNDQTNSYNCFITEDCEYPDAAWNLLMVMSSEEGSYRLRYGEKGTDWVDADAGTVSFLGLPASIKVLNENAYSDIGNQTWSSIVGTILVNAENEASQLSDDMSDWVQYKMNLMKDCYNYYYEAVERTPENVVGFISYSVEEDEAVKVARTNTTGWINQCRASFCTGSGDKFTDPNNDAQWEAYIKGIEDQDIASWIEIAQALYDEQYGGK